MTPAPRNFLTHPSRRQLLLVVGAYLVGVCCLLIAATSGFITPVDGKLLTAVPAFAATAVVVKVVGAYWRNQRPADS